MKGLKNTACRNDDDKLRTVRSAHLKIFVALEEEGASHTRLSWNIHSDVASPRYLGQRRVATKFVVTNRHFDVREPTGSVAHLKIES